MRRLAFFLAISCVTWGMSSAASAETLTASDCRPLSSSNADACCAAANWQKLVRPQDASICKRRTQTLTSSPPAAVGSPPDTTTPPGTTNPPGTDTGFNNGFGNGNQSAPGGSLPNNNAENANNGTGRNNPSGSPNSGN
jgi:hypothetical protein